MSPIEVWIHGGPISLLIYQEAEDTNERNDGSSMYTNEHISGKKTGRRCCYTDAPKLDPPQGASHV